MLAIRLQRTGRSGHAQYRMIVQDARRSPTSGKVVVSLGNYDPHTKTVSINTEKASFYLEHGAQPSPRVAAILKKEGVKLPKWVEMKDKQERAIKNTEKLRRNRPADAEAPATETASEEAPAETTEEPIAETTGTVAAETPAEEAPAADTETTSAEPTEAASAEPAEVNE